MFKQGDLIYCPLISNKIYVLIKTVTGLAINVCEEYHHFNEEGYSLKHSSISPVLYHATYDNYEKLSSFYQSVKFEQPKKRTYDLVKLLIKAGHKNIALVSEIKDKTTKFILTAEEFNSITKKGLHDLEKCCVFDLQTDKKLIDYIPHDDYPFRYEI